MLDRMSSSEERNSNPQTNEITSQITELAEKFDQLATEGSRITISNEQSDSISKLANFPITKITDIESSLLKLSENVCELQQNIVMQPTGPESDDTNLISTAMHVSEVNVSHINIPTNTTSPKLKPKKPPCEPYLKYSTLAFPESTKSELLTFVTNNDDNFKPVGENESRHVLYYGDYSYRYSGMNHEAQEMPSILNSLLDVIKPNLPDPTTPINSCLITKYQSGNQHIPLHRDNELVINPESHIITVSLGQTRTMKFIDNGGVEKHDKTLEDSSVLVTTRYAQDYWQHGIDEDQSEAVRYSFTFRDIKPHYINSTIVMGDSNTALLKFGEGKGTLGSWLPGKRVKVTNISEIPAPEDIGPFRNIILHTGINSINNAQNRQSNRILIQTLESKIIDIVKVYPNAKVYVSLLLPTKSRVLNYQVREFNDLILGMTHRHKNVSVIENSLFGEILSDECGRWDFQNQGPLKSDILHLGKKGIRKFAKNIKLTVIASGKSQSRVRFRGSGGSYIEAVGRRERSMGGRGGVSRATESSTSTASSRGLPQIGGTRRSTHRGGHNENRFAALADHHDDET